MDAAQVVSTGQDYGDDSLSKCSFQRGTSMSANGLEALLFSQYKIICMISDSKRYSTFLFGLLLAPKTGSRDFSKLPAQRHMISLAPVAKQVQDAALTAASATAGAVHVTIAILCYRSCSACEMMLR